MTTKSKKTTKATPEVRDKGLHTVRSDETVILADTDILIAAPWLNPYATTRNYNLGVRAGRLTIIPRQALAPRSDGAAQLRAGNFKVIPDATEGELPTIVDVSDSWARTIWTTGAPPKPTRDDRVRGYQDVLIDRSLAECVDRLVEIGGWGVRDAMELLVKEYDAAFTRGNGDATRRSWVALTEKILDNSIAKGLA